MNQIVQLIILGTRDFGGFPPEIITPLMYGVCLSELPAMTNLQQSVVKIILV